jgi:hypothetical protein
MKLLSRISGYLIIAAAALAAVPAHAKWGAWQSLGGRIIGEPSLVTTSIGGTPTLFIAGRGGDNALWWTQKVGNGAWTAWRSAGGVITARPTCISRTPGIVDCFARGQDSSLAQRSFVNGAWNSWSSLGASGTNYAVGANYVAMNAGSDRVTVLDANGYLSELTWTPASSWSKWNSANIPGWSPANGPVGCAQRVTGVNESYVAFGKQYTDVGFEQACVAKAGGQFSLFVTAKNGGAFPLPELASNFMPDVSMVKTPEGLRVTIIFTSQGGMPVKRQYTLGKGWTNFPSGLSAEMLGGALTSGPSCSGKYCAGRGLDGAVWIVADE